MKIPTAATLKKYYVDEKFYTDLFILQHGKCAVCGKEPLPDGMPLVIDHKHFKVGAHHIEEAGPKYLGWKEGDGSKGWIAVAQFDHTILPWRFAKTKDAAIRAAKIDGMPYSIRGLLCPGRWSGCNRLMGRVDNIEWLEKTLAYLRKPPAQILLNR